MKLFRHQRKALRRVLKNDSYRLFMDQGTGKSLVAIKAIEARDVKRVMIIAPASIMLNWELEIKKFLDKPYILERLNVKQRGKKRRTYYEFLRQDRSRYTAAELSKLGYKGNTKEDMLKGYTAPLQLLLVNYEKTLTMFDDLMKFKPEFVIIDESQYIKNRNAKMTKATEKITRQAKYNLLMTGTPMPQGLQDLWSQYHVSDPSIFGNWGDFQNRYIVKGGFMGKQITGYKNEDEVKDIIKQTSFRVLLRDCTDLPPLTEEVIYCELDNDRYYKEMKDELLTTVENVDLSRSDLKAVLREHGVHYRPSESYASLLLKAQDYVSTASVELAITQIIRLQQITGGFLTLDSGEVVKVGHEKLDQLKQIIPSLPKPILIYCNFIAELDELKRELSPLYRVDIYRGSQKDQVYTSFNAGELDIMLLQYRSGSVGLNLQKAPTLIMYSHTNNASSFSQSISRILRTGQKNKMLVIQMVMKDTIDEDVLSSVKGKIDYSKFILDMV